MMVTYIYDKNNDIYVGPLNKQESAKVKAIYKKHGNSITECASIVIHPDVVICSYEDLIAQAEGRKTVAEVGRRGDGAVKV